MGILIYQKSFSKKAGFSPGVFEKQYPGVNACNLGMNFNPITYRDLLYMAYWVAFTYDA